MSVLPRESFPMEKKTLLNGVEREVIRLSPVASTDSTAFNLSNRKINFRLPSIPNSFIDPAQSYITFKVTLSAAGKKFYGCPFREFTLKASDSKILERVQSYGEFWHMQSFLKHSADFDNYRLINGISETAKTGASFYASHYLESGIFGDGNETFLPCGNLHGFAYEMELELNPTAVNYTDSTSSVVLTDVALYLNVCTLPQDVYTQFLDASGSMKLQYESVEEHSQSFSGSNATQTIHDANINVVKTDTIILETDADKQIKLISKVKDHQIVYMNKQMPLQKLSVDGDANKINSLMYNIAQNGKRVGQQLVSDWVKASAYGSSYRVSQSFKKSRDAMILSGLNTMKSAAPIEVKLTFDSPLSSHTMITFVRKAYALTIVDGKFSVVDDTTCSC